MLEEASENWRVERMAESDLAVLRLAIAEMKYMEDVPESVAINEAVNLSKKYGGENSSVFVNGVLGGIAKIGRV